MARMLFSGPQEVMEELFRESERLERKAAEMLSAAGEVAARAWKDAIRQAGHAPPGKSGRATGEMAKGVKAGKIQKKGDAYMTEVYPRGKDRQGTRLAEIAFILHYGTSRIKGDHFVDLAEERAESAVAETMEQIWRRD